jgi:hypothetical protein
MCATAVRVIPQKQGCYQSKVNSRIGLKEGNFTF